MTDSEQARECYLTSLRLLAGRDYTAQELLRKLQQRGCTPVSAKAAIERLAQEGYQSDRRYAERFIASARESGRFTGYRLRYELQRRGVGSELLEQLLQEAPDQDDELVHARALVARRYSSFDPQLADDRERRRVAGFLQRRGYRTEIVYRLLSSKKTSTR